MNEQAKTLTDVGTLTTGEQAEVVALTAAWDWVKAVRAASGESWQTAAPKPGRGT
tara:strand:+ start:275 stop:439 length:165 start_codon:yes stop_codon:yes gene_type:complete